MAEQPHSSDEMTGMREKLSIQEMFLKLMNRMDSYGEQLEQNRKERK
jgi:hypothetical protein